LAAVSADDDFSHRRRARRNQARLDPKLSRIVDLFFAPMSQNASNKENISAPRSVFNLLSVTAIEGRILTLNLSGETTSLRHPP